MADRPCPAFPAHCCDRHGRRLPLSDLGRCSCACHDEPAPTPAARLCPARPLNCCVLQGRNVPPGQVGRCTCPCHENAPLIAGPDAPDAEDECRALLNEFATAADFAGPGLRYSAPHVAEKLAALAVRARRMLLRLPRLSRGSAPGVRGHQRRRLHALRQGDS